MSAEKFKDTRKPWFRFVKKIMRLFIKESKFTYLGDELTQPTIVLQITLELLRRSHGSFTVKST